MPKAYKYSIIYNGVTTVLTTDPKGWQEESIGFTRSDDHGLNVEYTVPLSFAKEGYKKLKEIFSAGGMFAVAQLKIEKRNNSWGFGAFYLYKLDFKTYKDNSYSVEISGLEDGLLSKFNANSDTAYDITLPTVKQSISYEGVSIQRDNTIQAGVGTLDMWYAQGGNRHFPLKGSRAVRSYTADFSFVDDSGTPFTTMTFKCVNAVTVPTFKIDMGHVMKLTTFPIAPPRGKMQLIKHNADWTSIDWVLDSSGISVEYVANSTHVNIGARYDYFTYNDVRSIAFEAGSYYSLCYLNGSLAADHLPEMGNTSDTAYDGHNTRITIAYISPSEYSGHALCIFTYEWLINALLLKIDSTSVLEYNILNPNFIPVLSSAVCFRNLGSLNFTGVVTISLREVLKSLNVVSCIGIDVTGNKMTVAPLANFYKRESAGRLKAKNITLSFSEAGVFNTIKAGSKATDLVKNGLFAFNCNNTFTVADSTLKADLDLENPFKTDMYSIDKIIGDAASSIDTTTSNNGDLIIFAANTTVVDNAYTLLKDSAAFVSGFAGDKATAYNLPLSPKRILNTHKDYVAISNYKNVKNILYSSTDINADMVSKLSWESESVSEKADVVTSNPIFLPITISFDTAERYDTLISFQADKYKYYEVLNERTGRIIKGWANKITFGVTKEQSQNWELQAYEV